MVRHCDFELFSSWIGASDLAAFFAEFGEVHMVDIPLRKEKRRRTKATVAFIQFSYVSSCVWATGVHDFWGTKLSAEVARNGPRIS